MATAKHTHHAEEHPSHGTLGGYLMGFLLSVNLTAIPFWLVMGRPLEGVFGTHVPVAFLLMAFAVVQMVVHMVYFLHMHPRSESGWTFMALFFTLIVVVIVMSGSMWVMYHLNTNMMPTHDMTQMGSTMDSTTDSTGESWIPSAPSLPAVPSSTTPGTPSTTTQP